MTSFAAVSGTHRVALITGASAGIGFEFAVALAGRGYDLILTARRGDRLADLAARLRTEHEGIRVEIVVADLSEADSSQQIARAVAGFGMNVDLLVNNAGFGSHGRFESLVPEGERDQIAVNVAAMVALTHAFLP